MIRHLVRDPLPPFGWEMRTWVRLEVPSPVSRPEYLTVWDPAARASEHFS